MRHALVFAALALLILSTPLHAQPRPTFELGTHEGVPWPIIPAPVWPPPRMPSFPGAATPASPASTRIAALMQSLTDVDSRDALPAPDGHS